MSRKENTFQMVSNMSRKRYDVHEDLIVRYALYEFADGELERVRERVEHLEKTLSRLLSELLNRRVLNLDELGDILGEAVYLKEESVDG